MDESELKVEFAKLLLKEPTDPFVVALKLFPENVNRALKVAVEWPGDSEVKAAQEKLLSEVEDEFSLLPTKASFSNLILAKMGEAAPDDFAKLAKVYADVRGFIEKASTNVNTGNTVVNKVMIVKDNGTDDEWSAKLLKQQEKLVSESGG